MNKIILYVLIISLMLMAFVTGSYSGFFVGDTEDPALGITTFIDKGGDVCYEDGKPVIRMYSTSWCPHCGWVSPTFDRIAKEYMDAGKIVAYHWLLDTGDNTLTPETETEVPPAETQVYNNFNPRNSIPTFVFGCRYYRVGTGYEKQQNLTLEENEFRAVIESLL